MANIKISDLTAASVAADANEFEINEAGTSKKVTGSQIKAYVNSADGALASLNTVGSAQIDNAAVTGTKIATDTITASNIAANAVGASELNVSGDGTAGQVLSSDGDGSFSWANAGGFFTQSVTFTTDTTVTSANAGKVYFTSTSNLKLTLPAPPGGTDVLAYGIVNDSATDLIVEANNTSTQYIGDWLGTALIQSKEECIIVSVGSNWKLIATNAASSINIVQFTSSGTYTPDSTVSSFLACVGGATSGSSPSYGAGGGGYAEKFYASPSGSYTVTLGAAGVQGGVSGGTTTFGGTVTVNSSEDPGAGTASGGDWNVSGGTGGTTSGGRGGGAGGAGRAGIGGNGASGTGSQAGAGGGTGGNNASGYTGGAAATTQNGSAYNLSALFSSFTFNAGDSVTPGQTVGAGGGAAGDQNITKLDGSTGLLYGGRPGNQASNTGYYGYQGYCTVVEFKG